MDRDAETTQNATIHRGATLAAAQWRVTPLEHRAPPIIGDSRIAELHLDVTPLAAGTTRFEHQSAAADASATGRRRGRFLHVAVNDVGGWAYAEVLGRPGIAAQAGFALRAVERARRRSIPIHRLISDHASALRAEPLGGRCRTIGVSLEQAESMAPWTRAQTERFVCAATAGWAGNAQIGANCEWTHTGSGWIAVEDI